MKNEYPYSLKNFNEPILKKDGTEFRFGTIMPLIGGMSLSNAYAIQKKPEFLLSFKGFQNNEKHLREYWPDVPYLIIDDENFEADLSLHKGIFENIDFVSSVPICSGLSNLNSQHQNMETTSSKTRGSDAEQNEWMYKVAEFALDRIKPKVYWGENAPNLFTPIGEGVVEKLYKIAKKYNYSFSLMKTNTFLHGIPQKRERTYFFFWNAEYAPILNYYNIEAPTLEEYISVLPKELEHTNENSSGNRTPFDLYPTFNWILKEIEKCTYKEFAEKYQFETLYSYLHRNNLLEQALEYVKTNFPESSEIRWLEHIINKINKNMGYWDHSPQFFDNVYMAVISRNMCRGLHPTEERYCNVRELMWLMGLPWDFNLVRDEKGRIPVNHIAQNVPVITTRDWCLEVIKFIEGKLPSSGKHFLKQNNTNPEIFQIAMKLF